MCIPYNVINTAQVVAWKARMFVGSVITVLVTAVWQQTRMHSLFHWSVHIEDSAALLDVWGQRWSHRMYVNPCTRSCSPETFPTKSNKGIETKHVLHYPDMGKWKMDRWVNEELFLPSSFLRYWWIQSRKLWHTFLFQHRGWEFFWVIKYASFREGNYSWLRHSAERTTRWRLKWRENFVFLFFPSRVQMYAV